MTQVVGIKARLLALSEGHVLVRKARKFELLSSNSLSVIAKKTLPGQIELTE